MVRKFRTIIAISIIVYILCLFSPGLIIPVHSQTAPPFTSCTSPQGTIKVQHPSGTHGIAGETTNHTGSDTVYNVSGNALTQCFCSDKGEGIQTNWWKITSLTSTNIAVLEREGWIRIPNGTLWGLEEGEYLAKNAPYICANERVGGASDTKSSDVLGLASTGTIIWLLSFLFAGCFFLFIALLLKRRSDRDINQ